MLISLSWLMNKYQFQPKGVLHLGASEGQERFAYKEQGIDTVIWVEAIPKVFETLLENVKDIPNAICINACISDVDNETVSFNISSHGEQSSSMLEFGEYHLKAHPEVSMVDKKEMTTIRLDTLLGPLALQDVDFLNADLQGSELKAIKGMGDLLHNFKWAYLEVNKNATYIGCPLVDEVDEYMATFGFTRVETSNWIGDCWGDAFYIKK